MLDTWFSSALWPFSTLGWPEQTPELDRYYPTDVLITGFDIIFFWVARMMMMGLHFMDEVPFHTVYIHALVRDENGQKMSKSKGNVIDPLDLIDRYGADALRFTLTAFAAQGRDVKLSESRVEGYRNFCTKLWNAARFCEMNECKPVDGFDPKGVQSILNKWIVGKTAEAEARLRDALEAYRFNDAATAIYQFIWGTYCDWYLELVKPVLQGDGDEAAKAEARATAAWVLDQILVLAHPVIPFITEELWQSITDDRPQRLIAMNWPTFDASLIDADVNAEIDWVVRLISQVRAVRSEMNIPPSAKLPMFLKDAGANAARYLETNRAVIERLARLENTGLLQGDVPDGAVQDVLDEAVIILPIKGAVDLDAERERLDREIAKQDKEIQRFEGKLGNQKFVANAPAEVVETERERLTEARQAREKLEEARTRLLAVG